jgi:phosphoribosylanthranilate isomerase
MIKICGVTRIEDALLINSLGADAIGFIFHAKSERFISFEEAAKITHALSETFIDDEVNIGTSGFSGNHRSARILRVGVFVNPTIDTLKNAVEIVGLDGLQLHGNENKDFVSEVRYTFPKLKLIKAIRLKTHEETIDYDVDFKLLDHSGSAWGGTGIAIDWSQAKAYIEQSKIPVILAGGIRAENILEAMRVTGAEGIDLSSGVESAPGIKSEKKLRDLFQTLQRGSA